MTTKTKPLHEVRFGNVRVSLWANQGEEGKTFHNFSLERSYRDRSGNWQSQQISMAVGEVAKVVNALNTAYADYYTLPDLRADYQSSAEAAPQPEPAA